MLTTTSAFLKRSGARRIAVLDAGRVVETGTHEQLLAAGFDVYLLDWGEPDERDAHNQLEDYVDDYIPAAVARVLELSGTAELTLVGYCFGGNLALLYAAHHPDAPVRSLTVMATPVDFQHLGPLATVFRNVMSPPFFPITPDELRGDVAFEAVADDDFALNGAKVRSRWVRHTDPTLGFRVEMEGMSVAYLSDHGPGTVAEDADEEDRPIGTSHRHRPRGLRQRPGDREEPRRACLSEIRIVGEQPHCAGGLAF